MEYSDLILLAAKVKERAYAPYSSFRVGAALLTDTGRIYTGVNVENASYGATVCAERTAVAKAVSEGHKGIRVIAIASDSDDFIYPCGICRQVLEEFGRDDTKVICTNKSGKFEEFTLGQLLPKAFHKRYH